MCNRLENIGSELLIVLQGAQTTQMVVRTNEPGVTLSGLKFCVKMIHRQVA